MNGTIKRLIEDKGFGFLRGEDGNEYFFHQSSLKNAQFADLHVGQDVTFEESEGQKGLRAEDVFV